MSVNVILFIGIESFTWSDADFTNAINFCKQNQLDGLMVKVFDGMQGEWYNGRFPAIYAAIKSAGLICVPYGFHYGNNKGSSLTGEAQLGLKYMQTYGLYCGNLERSWDGQGDWAGQLAGIWANHPGQLWISTWANVADEPDGHRWLTNISHLGPITQSFMPEVYCDTLYAAAQNDWPVTQGNVHVEPTFDLSQEFGSNNVAQLVQTFLADKKLNNGKVQNITLWEWQFAQQSPELVKQIVQIVKGEAKPPSMGIQTNNSAILDLRQSFQLDDANNESQDMCGPWSVAELKYAGLPGKGPTGSAQQIDDWAENEYTKYIGPNVGSDTQGSSIDNMHQFFKDAGLHWCDITAISPSSGQTSDLAHVRGALAAGYPVVVTANEQSVISKKLGHCPYPWQPKLGPVNHVFTIVGVDSAGDLICADELNNQESWPMVYRAANIELHWASIVQVVGPDPNHPWILPIPSNEPATWPTNFNAQNFAGNAQSIAPHADSFPQEAQDCWNSFFNTIKQAPLPFNTGIANAWKQAWLTGKQYGPPLTAEYHSKNEQGQDIVVQEFAHARCEWLNNMPTFYSFAGKA